MFLTIAFILFKIHTSDLQYISNLIDRRGKLKWSAKFEDLGFFGSSSSLENEIEVLKSRRIISKVIDELDLKEYRSIGERNGFQSKEFYLGRPVDLIFHESLQYNFKTADVRIRLVDKNKFKIQCTLDEELQDKMDGKFASKLQLALEK